MMKFNVKIIYLLALMLGGLLFSYCPTGNDYRDMKLVISSHSIRVPFADLSISYYSNRNLVKFYNETDENGEVSFRVSDIDVDDYGRCYVYAHVNLFGFNRTYRVDLSNVEWDYIYLDLSNKTVVVNFEIYDNNHSASGEFFINGVNGSFSSPFTLVFPKNMPVSGYFVLRDGVRFKFYDMFMEGDEFNFTYNGSSARFNLTIVDEFNNPIDNVPVQIDNERYVANGTLSVHLSLGRHYISLFNGLESFYIRLGKDMSLRKIFDLHPPEIHLLNVSMDKNYTLITISVKDPGKFSSGVKNVKAIYDGFSTVYSVGSGGIVKIRANSSIHDLDIFAIDRSGNENAIHVHLSRSNISNNGENHVSRGEKKNGIGEIIALLVIAIVFVALLIAIHKFLREKKII